MSRRFSIVVYPCLSKRSILQLYNGRWDDDDDDDGVLFVPDHHVYLNFYSVVYWNNSPRTYYPDSEPTSPCTWSAVLHA